MGRVAKVRVNVRIDEFITATALCDVQETIVTVTELRLLTRDRRHGISSRTMVNLPLAKIRIAALGEADAIPNVKLPPYGGLYCGHGPTKLLPVALRYATLVREGHRRPAQMLAKEIGLTVKQTTDLLLRVRRHGLLTPGYKSVLTKKARKLMEEVA